MLLPGRERGGSGAELIIFEDELCSLDLNNSVIDFLIGLGFSPPILPSNFRGLLSFLRGNKMRINYNLLPILFHSHPFLLSTARFPSAFSLGSRVLADYDWHPISYATLKYPSNP